MAAIPLAIMLGTTSQRGGGGDSTPGGATDVWLWEDGIGVLWEDGIFMKLE